MKKLLVTCLGVLFFGAANAQQPKTAVDPATMEITTPEYVFCEIITADFPSHTGDGVIFDFGQQTTAWVYNWLKDADGNNLLFESGVGALNYMVFRGWEFVQAYTSGEKSERVHYLLRLPASKLSPVQQEQLLTPPRIKGEKKR